MIGGFGGVSANLHVSEDLKKAVESAREENLRAIQVVADGKAEKLTCDWKLKEGATLEEDFAAIAAQLQDGAATLILVRLKGNGGDETSVPGVGQDDWAILGWTPDGAPVMQRMLCASSKKNLSMTFTDLTFKEYSATERDEVTLAQFVEQTRALTKADRENAMTLSELEEERVKEAIKKERDAKPKMLPGLVALRIKTLETFDAALSELLADDSKAVVARLQGNNSEVLGGEVLTAIESPSSLKGQLSAEEPCYVIIRPKQGRFLLLSWLPDNAPVKLKMKTSTFKSSVRDILLSATQDFEVVQKEVCDEDDLSDDLALVEPTKSVQEFEASSGPAAPKTGGYRPAGSISLPGMGAGPPGGFALPGMGGRK